MGAHIHVVMFKHLPSHFHLQVMHILSIQSTVLQSPAAFQFGPASFRMGVVGESERYCPSIASKLTMSAVEKKQFVRPRVVQRQLRKNKTRARDIIWTRYRATCTHCQVQLSSQTKGPVGGGRRAIAALAGDAPPVREKSLS